MMPTLEVINLTIGRSEPTKGLGWCILLEKDTPEKLIKKIKDAWILVASLGRTEDTQLGEWPLLEDFKKLLPEWLSSSNFEKHGYNIENWWSDLEEREWIWWSSSRQQNGIVRIDLKAFAMPISDWTLRVVIELAGATIVARDIDLADDLVKKHEE